MQVESFLESLWYSSYLEIYNAMMLKRQSLKKDTELSGQYRGDGET